MTEERWLTAALTNETVVAELLLRLKQSSSDSTRVPPPQPTIATTSKTCLSSLRWGNRKYRSKSAAVNGSGKEQRRCSPTTPLLWTEGGNGDGGDCSVSDGYDEYSNISDLSSENRSIKGEGASSSIFKKSKKRKSFDELKEEEGLLLTERVYLNKELASMRITLDRQMATSKTLKRIKIDLHQNGGKGNEMTFDHEPQNPAKALTRVNELSCRVKTEYKTHEREFVLPDLNMMPTDGPLGEYI